MKHSINSSKKEHILIYDGFCALCSTSVKKITKKQAKNPLKTIPFQKLSHSIRSSELKEKLRTEAFLIKSNGEILRGVAALFYTMQLLPGFWGAFGKVLHRKFFITFFNPFYRVIAKNRYILSQFLRLRVVTDF